MCLPLCGLLAAGHFLNMPHTMQERVATLQHCCNMLQRRVAALIVNVEAADPV